MFKMWETLWTTVTISSFYLDLLKWIRLETATDDDDYENIPYMRYGHTVSAVGDMIYLFGGRNEQYGACNILYCFDTSK
jgi:hypothetical protein